MSICNCSFDTEIPSTEADVIPVMCFYEFAKEMLDLSNVVEHPRELTICSIAPRRDVPSRYPYSTSSADRATSQVGFRHVGVTKVLMQARQLDCTPAQPCPFLIGSDHCQCRRMIWINGSPTTSRTGGNTQPVTGMSATPAGAKRFPGTRCHTRPLAPWRGSRMEVGVEHKGLKILVRLFVKSSFDIFGG